MATQAEDRKGMTVEHVRVVTSTLSDAYVGNLDGINRKTKPRSMACPRCIGGRIIGNDPSCANCGYDADTSRLAAAGPAPRGASGWRV